jgi:hypothetical protein
MELFQGAINHVLTGGLLYGLVLLCFQPVLLYFITASTRQRQEWHNKEYDCEIF